MCPHELPRSAKPSFPFRQHTIYTICFDCINIFGENQPRIIGTSYFTSNLAKFDFLVCCGSEWAKKEKLKSFAGYPLIYNRNAIGVLAMFSEKKLHLVDFETSRCILIFVSTSYFHSNSLLSLLSFIFIPILCVRFCLTFCGSGSYI
jgi:hypothetical protein